MCYLCGLNTCEFEILGEVMTVQDVKIVDLKLPTDVAWAREVTMQRLLEQAQDQTSALNVLANVAPKAKKEAAEASRSLKDLSKGTDEYLDTLEDVVKAERKRERERSLEQELINLKNRKYRESMDDLRENLSTLSRSASSPSDAFNLLTDKLNVFGGRLSEKDGKLRLSGIAIQGFNKALAAASFAFGALAGITDPYRSMVESGLLFEGSAVRFARSALDSGLNLQQFSRIAGQYSETVSAVGGQAYTESIKRFRDSAQQFGYYGMNMEELADAQSRYMSSMRESGTLFNMSAREQDEATHDYLKNLTAVSILQGKSRRQLEDEQQKAQRRAQIALTIERIRRTQGDVAAEEVKRNYGEMVNRLGETRADVSFAQQYGLGGPTREEARRLGPSGLLESAMSPVDFRNRESVEQFIRRGQQDTLNISPDLLQTLAIGARTGTGAADAARELGEGERNLFTRARAELAGSQAGQRRAQANAARQGQIIDRTTERVLTAQVAGAEALNSLKSAALGAAEQLGILRGVAEAAAAAAGAASAGGGMLSGATGSFGGAALVGGGLLAGYLIPKILGGMALRAGAGSLLSRFRAPATPTNAAMFGPPIPGTAGGAAGRMGMLGRMGSMGGMLGTAGGVAGVGLGGYQAATGESRADRMMGIGGALASGALTGAMLGGVPGAVIGGVLGGGSALLANMFANGNQPAGTPAPSPTAPAAPQLSSLMNTYWGETSLIMLALNRIENLTAKVVNNTNRTANAVQ